MTKTLLPSGLTASEGEGSTPTFPILCRATQSREPFDMLYATVATSQYVTKFRLIPVTKTFDPSGLAAMDVAESTLLCGPL